MLVVLRKVLPGVGIAVEVGDVESEAIVVFRVGTAGVECIFIGLGVGKPEDEYVTDRESGLLGVAIEAAASVGRGSGASGMSRSGFRVFVIGSAGNGPFGGAEGGGLRTEGR